MNKTKTALCILGCAILVGCAFNRTVIEGRDFDTGKASQITKGVSTMNDVYALYGEPFKKEVKSSSEVFVEYYWRKTLVTTTGGFGGPNIRRSGDHKYLQILFTNDIVANYVIRQGPFEDANLGGKK